jgi:Ca2+-binding RTX toxin-like protein
VAVSVTVPGANSTLFGVTTNAQPSTASASVAQTISNILNSLPASSTTSVNGSFSGPVNNLALRTGGMNLTVHGGTGGSSYDYLSIEDGLNETITATGSGPFKVLAGTGGLNYTGLAGAQTVIAGGGTLGGASNIINLSGSTGPNFVAVGGGPDTVVSGSGADTVFSGGSGTMVVSVGSGTMDFVGGSNNATVFGGAHTSTIIGGASGSIVYSDTAGGAAEYHAQGGSEVFDARLSNGNNSIYGAYNVPGSETLFGGSGDNYINPLNATASVIGGIGADTLVGARFNASVTGSANATLTGGAGSDTFEFVNGYAGGHDYVTDLTANDVVNLAFYGYTPTGISSLLASATVSGGSSTITLSDATKITFVGLSSLNPGNFTSS